MFPGAGFVELVLRAGDEVGCGVVEELTSGCAVGVARLRVGCGCRWWWVVPGSRVGVRCRCFPVVSDGRWVLHARGCARCWCGTAVVGFVGVAAGGGAGRWMCRMVMSGWPAGATSMVRRFGGCGRCGAGVMRCLLRWRFLRGWMRCRRGVRGAADVVGCGVAGGGVGSGGAVMALPFLWQGVSLHAAGASAAAGADRAGGGGWGVGGSC